MKFQVPVRFEAVGWVNIEADTPEEASALVRESKPNHFEFWETIDGSFIVDAAEPVGTE